MTDAEIRTLRSIIRETDDGTDNAPTLVVARLLTEHPDVLTALLLPLIREAIRQQRRSVVRTVEQRGEPFDSLAERKSLLAECFLVPGVGLVAWGAATAEQHKARADELRAQAASVVATAERHEAAVREIETAGVRCLNEIGKRRRKKVAA
jgi:hypothetical protein